MIGLASALCPRVVTHPWRAGSAATLLSVMTLVLVLGVISVLVALYAIWLIASQRRSAEDPPFIHGGIPYLGVAIAFGKDVLGFLRKQQQLHGEVFTLLLAGKRMTFLMNPAHANVILKGPPQLDFMQTATLFSDRVPGTRGLLKLRGAIDEMHKQYIPNLQGTALIGLTDRFMSKLRHFLQRPGSILDKAQKARSSAGADGGWIKEGLWHMAADSIMYASAESLFGDGVWYPELTEQFNKWDSAAPALYTGVPAWLLGLEKFRERMAETLLVQRDNISSLIQKRMTSFQEFKVDRYNQGRIQLAVLWAAQSNTMSAVFWTLFYIARDAALQQRIVAEWSAIVMAWSAGQQAEASDGNDQNSSAAAPPSASATPQKAFCQENLRKLYTLDSVMNEVLRLHSSTIVARYAAADVTLELPLSAGEKRPIMIRKDDIVALNTEVIHLDPDTYPDPLVFKFDRFYTPDGTAKKFYSAADGTEVRNAFLPFGGGSHMCPGRFFVMNEAKLMVLSLLDQFEFTLAPNTPVPPVDRRRVGLGVQQVLGDVEFSYRLRE